VSCAGDGRRHEFSGRSQPLRIDLRHATDIAVLERAAIAHSTTSPMPCFLVVATRRAAVRNSFRS